MLCWEDEGSREDCEIGESWLVGFALFFGVMGGGLMSEMIGYFQ
ncbi:putative membrane protein [Lyngbya aestuarii BL J]|uniref:Putative membrane protein n=1 Tax=Lyngbya aestuarii BL J TaxID=1348334 RepID=U7QL94_9CYAN|nr:putative membrane protein [Lyngbya aestuarii BL J]